MTAVNKNCGAAGDTPLNSRRVAPLPPLSLTHSLLLDTIVYIILCHPPLEVIKSRAVTPRGCLVEWV